MFDFLQGSTILVSGATGMIGSQIVEALVQLNREQQANITMVALYRNMAKRDEMFSHYIDEPGIIWLCQDVASPVSYDGSVDYIVHTAGVTGGSKQHVDLPMRTISTALNGTINLLELARDKQSKGFVYLSSLEVYGKTDFNIQSIKETDGGYIDSMAVRSSYSESKRMCETICAAYAKQYQVPAKVVRLAPTYGAGASYQDGRVLCEFARCIIEHKDIVLRSLGDTIRNYCDVSDAVKAILTVLERGVSGQAYNIANMETEISIKGLAERFIALYPEAGVSLKFDLPKDIAQLGYNQTIQIRLDTKKLESLGWKPTVDLNAMIQNLVSAMIKAKDNG